MEIKQCPACGGHLDWRENLWRCPLRGCGYAANMVALSAHLRERHIKEQAAKAYYRARDAAWDVCNCLRLPQLPDAHGDVIDRLRQVAAVSAEHTSIVNSSQTMAGVTLIKFADGYAEISNRKFFGVTLSPHQYDALFDMMTKDYDVRMKGEVADLLEETT